jgi:hypothetical protein
MATARDLIIESYRASGLTGLGQSIEGEELQEGLKLLNQEISVLNNQGLFPPYETIFEFTLTGGQDVYSIGSGGDIDIPRPLNIEWGKVKDGNTYFTMDQKTLRTFGQYSTQESGSVIPRTFYYNPSYPLGQIGFLRPLDGNRDFKLNIKHYIGEYGINDEVALPDGYYALLKWKLADVLNDVNGHNDGGRSKMKAQEIVATIKSNNVQRLELKSNFSKRRRWNYKTGENE